MPGVDGLQAFGLPVATSGISVRVVKATPPQVPQVPGPVDRKVAEMLQRLAGLRSTSMSITVDETTGRFITRVHDAQTGELIRECPQASVVNAIDSLLRSSGLHVDDIA